MIKLSPAEGLKTGSDHLRGTLKEELAQDTTAFSKPATGLLKFHGIYQQDDRDLRKTQPGRSHTCMVRVSLPGGQLTPAQYFDLDGLADSVGDGTLRITSRGGIQYHSIAKKDAKQLISTVIKSGLNTWAACGDVVRNVVACAAPFESPERHDITEYVKLVARELKPKTGAYLEIWLDGERAVTLESEEEEVETLYGASYLPRKFKIAFAFPGDNTTDIYSHDLGFVPKFENGQLTGFTLLAGGGMGQSNGVKLSHPRMADEICFIPKEEILAAAKAVVTIHRDFGNRENRKLARLKYVLDEKGVDWFREEFGRRMGKTYAAVPPLQWTRQADYLGWHQQSETHKFYGLRIMNGRVTVPLRAAVREILNTLGCGVRMTAQQNILLTDIPNERTGELDEILKRHNVTLAEQMLPVLRYSMACPALPTCGLALSEAERRSPEIMSMIDDELAAAGVPGERVFVRMTGCPNGCARPYTAEIGIVGQSIDLYSLYLGGSHNANRMAKLHQHNVKAADLASTFRPIFTEFAQNRQPGESFGDYWFRSHQQN
jgi:sulfite reductase (ferredoxin)